MSRQTIDPEFFDDSSRSIGLSHSATRVEEIVAIERPVFNAESNPLLADPGWNERENARLEADLRLRGEPLPPRVHEGRGGFGKFEDRDVEEQYLAELARLEKSRPDLTYPQQQALAHEIVAKRQRQIPKNAGAYDDERRELALVAREYPELTLIEQHRMARERVAQREALGDAAPIEKTAEERSREYLGSPVEDLMGTSLRVHSGGGGGNRTQVLRVRYCPACAKRWKRELRAPEPPKKRFRTVWTPPCACGAPPIYKAEMVQQMGAKASGGGGSKGRTRDDRKKSGALDVGRPPIESEPRSNYRTLRISDFTERQLAEIEAETGINLPALLAALAIMNSKKDALSRFVVEKILAAAPKTKSRKRRQKGQAA